MDSEKIHELIQQYIDQTMSTKQRNAFEHQLETDPLLKQEYSLMRDIDNELKNKELIHFKSQLKSVSNDFFKSEKEPKSRIKIFSLRSRKLLSIAASILLLISVFIWGINNRSANSPISYYDFNEIYSDGLRGQTSPSTSNTRQKKQIVNLLDKGNYDEVINLLTNKPEDDNTILLLGHAYLQKAIFNKSEKSKAIGTAINTVSPLLNNTNLKVRYEAEWILMLSFSESPEYQSNYKNLLQKILQNQDHSFYAKAKEIHKNNGK